MKPVFGLGECIASALALGTFLACPGAFVSASSIAPPYPVFGSGSTDWQDRVSCLLLQRRPCYLPDLSLRLATDNPNADPHRNQEVCLATRTRQEPEVEPVYKGIPLRQAICDFGSEAFGDRQSSFDATHLYQFCRSSAKTRAVLFDCLLSSNPDQCTGAILLLLGNPFLRLVTIPLLLERFRHEKSPLVRKIILLDLAGFTTFRDPVFPFLRPILFLSTRSVITQAAVKDVDNDVRRVALDTLLNAEVDSLNCIEVLTTCLGSTDTTIFEMSAKALASKLPITATADLIMRSLQEKDDCPALMSVEALYQSRASRAAELVGKRNPEVIPLLCKWLSHDRKIIRAFAMLSLNYSMREHRLRRLPIEKDSKAARSLIAMVCDPNDAIKSCACLVIGYDSRIARMAMPVLLKNLESKNHFVLQAAAVALGQSDVDSPAAIRKLVKLLDLIDIRMSVISALERLGYRARSAAPVVIDVYEEGLNSESRCCVVKCLLAIAPEDPEVREFIVKALKESKDERVRAVLQSALNYINRES